MSNPYWNGVQKAHLTQEQVTAAWGRRGTPHSLTAIAFVNRAFEIYYDAMQKIQECPDHAQATLMFKELRDAATEGWGFGISDLEEAFEHLHANRGRWTDGATRNYYGGPNKVFHRAIVTAPVSIVNFMNAVDSRMSRLRTVVQNFDRQTRELARAQQAEDWDRVGKILGEIKKWGERAKPFLWFAPRAEARVGQASSFAGVLSQIHTGLTIYTRSRQAGFSEGMSTAITALRTAVGWVPVLGSFYGKAVEMIPGLATWYRGLIENRIRQIERAAAGY